MRYRQLSNSHRQKLIREDHGKAPPGGVPKVNDLQHLHALLQNAIAVEHFTIPPYLYALYSLKDGASGPNSEAYSIIRSVVMEEMLHLILAANVLNAVGGSPRIVPKRHKERYPQPMPHSAIGFQVDLLKFSKGAINTFLRIERPAERIDAPPAGEFWSIGEMYAVIREGLNRLDREAKETGRPKGIFTVSGHMQVTEQHYYGSGGKMMSVCSIEDANRALDEIVGQGEGIDGTIDDGGDYLFGAGMEVAHYFRFNEIFCERRYQRGDQADGAPTGKPLPVAWDAVYNALPNPTIGMFDRASCVYAKMNVFNDVYSQMLRDVERACTGQPEVLLNAIPRMYALRDLAIELMNEESGKGDYTAGPSFEYNPNREVK